jgi:hypothetical protein
MPKTNKQGKPKENELPGTLKRSPKKAQKTFAKAHDSAADQYGDGERASVGPALVLSGARVLRSGVGGVDYYGNSKEGPFSSLGSQ